MVSKTNFFLGIKQASLHSKEISHMHNNRDQPPPSQPLALLPPKSGLHGIMQPPLLTPLSKIHKPRKLCPSNHRSVQIEPLPVETNHIDVLHGIPRQKPKNPISIGISMCLHTWLKLRRQSYASLMDLTLNRSVRCTHHPIGLDIHRSTKW